jgi:hypothetical protein
MKTKLLLMLLALTGLGWGVDRAEAYTAKGTDSTAHLSQTMGELIGFDRDTYSLLAVAIDRALIAQSNGFPQPTTAGVPLPTNTSPPKKQREIMGKIAVPTQPAIGQTKIEKPKPRLPGKPSTTKN